MHASRFAVLFLLGAFTVFLQGCMTAPLRSEPEKRVSQVDFADPVLKDRKILLFGPIDRRAAEVTIKKLLFLESKGQDPIDLFLETPGGEVKYAWAIVQTLRHIHSPVNTYALSECNSGGAMLLAAGSGKRRAFGGAVIVIHGLAVRGKPPASFVKAIQESYTDFWRKRARLPESWLPLPFDSFRVLTAEQALQYGIVDEVVSE